MRVLQITAFALALAAYAEPLDRIAVTVGNQVITESALLLDLRLTAFLDEAPVDFSGAAKRRAAERLVEQALILREASDSHLALPTAENAAVLLGQVRAQMGGSAEYEMALRRYGLRETELLAHLLAGLRALTFTDLRFRPAVQISDEDLRAYYDTVSDGAAFEARREDVEAILVRQRIAEALDEWLRGARANTRVQYREQVFQ